MAVNDYEPDEMNGSYEEEPLPEQSEGWEHFLIAAPAWAGSVAFHGLLMLIFMQIVFSRAAPALPEVQAKIQEPEQELEEPEEPEEPEIPVNPNAEVEAPDPVEEAPLPFSDIDAEFDEPPGIPSEDPTDKMPLAIPRLALGSGGASRYLPGVFGHRGGRGRRRSLLRGGGTRESQEAVDRGLWWLAKVQEADGSWNCVKWGGRADGKVAVTGLALLAFLGAGHSDQEGPFQKNVTKACKFLSGAMKENGKFQHGSRMYGQGIAAMAISEAYGMGRSKWVGRAAQKSLNYIVKTQPDSGGFAYNGPGEDTSISGWNFMALKSGRICGLDVPDSAFKKMRRFCKDIYRNNGMSTYRTSRRDSGSEATTAIGLFCRIFLGWDKKDEQIQKPHKWISKKGVRLKNLYYTYYSTLSMFQLGGPDWLKWNKKFRDPLLKMQVNKQKKAKLGGSWPPSVKWGKQGGRVYSTAMAILSLEVYYRFLPIYRSK